MDAINGVLLQAAMALGSAAVDQATRSAIDDAWQALKSRVLQRFGTGTPQLAVIDELRARPAPDERLASLQLADDPPSVQLLQNLAQLLERLPPATRQGLGSSNVGAINVGTVAGNMVTGSVFNGPVNFG